MSVLVFQKVEDVIAAARGLQMNDVLVCGKWRVVRAMDGESIWVEREANLWSVPRGRGGEARLRKVLGCLPARTARLAAAASA